MAVRETLELDFSDAITGLGRLGDQITDVADTFRDSLIEALSVLEDIQPVDIPVDVDTDSLDDVQDQVAGLDATITVDADPTPAEEALAAVEEEIAAAQELLNLAVNLDPGEAQQILGEVNERAAELDSVLQGLEAELDVSAAEDALGALSASAEQFEAELDNLGSTAQGGGGIEGLTSGIESLTEVSSLGAESFGALVETIGDKFSESESSIGKSAAGIATAVGAITLAGQQLFSIAVEAESALQAFNVATGEFGAQIRNLNVGGLTGDLGDLAVKLGSDDEALLTFNQRVFQLGVASERTGAQAAKTAQQITAIAANAVALNPALGDVASVAQGLTNGLARGGRFLAQYGVSLTAAEINARALADTGKTTAAQLTQFDKTAAGAALAVEKLGTSIRDNVEEGAKNPAIQLRSLQQEFANFLEDLGSALPVNNVFDLLRTTLPLLKSVGGIVGSLASAVIPILNQIFVELTPAIDEFGKAVAESLIQLGPSIVELVQAFLRLNDPIQTLATASARVLPVFAEGLAIVITGVADLLELLEPAIVATDRWIRSLEVFGFSIGKAGEDGEAVAEATANVTDETDDAAAAARRAAGDFQALQSAFLGTVDAQDAYSDALDGIVDANEAVRDAQQSMIDAQEEQADAIKAIGEAQRGYESALRDIEDAERGQVDAIEAVVDAQERQRRSLDEVTDAQAELAEAEDALAKARKGRSEEDDLAIREARLQLAEAERKVTALAGDDAEAAANRAALAEAGFSEAIVGVIADQEEAILAAEEREKAAIALARAQGGLRKAEETAAGRVGEAEDRLAQARDRLSDAQKAAIKSAKDVEAAQRGVGDAALRVEDATRKAADAQEAIGRAQRDAVDAAEGVADAQDKVREAYKRVGDAQENAARQAITLEDTTATLLGVLREAGPGGVDSYIQRLEDLKVKHPEVAAKIDELIGKLRDLAGQAPAAEAGAASGNVFADTFLGKVGEVPGKSEVALSNGFRNLDYAELAADFTRGLAVIRDSVVFVFDQTRLMVTRKGEEIVEALASGISSRVNDVRSSVQDIVDTVTGTIGDTRDLLYETGRNILDGLLRGISDRLNEIGGFLGDVRDRIVEGFNRVFGINSPAKVMIPTGEHITEGIAVGVGDAAGLVVAEAERIVRDAQVALDRTQLNPSIGATGSLAGGGGGVQVGQINMPMTFAAGTSQDEARALAGAAMDGALNVLELRTAVRVS